MLPDLINVVPGGVRLSLDLRSVSDRGELCRQIVAFARERGAARGVGVEWIPRQELPVQPMDAGVVAALRASAGESGEPFRQMPSGAAHDTQCVASRVPSAMVFVPVRRRPLAHAARDGRPGRRGARRGGRLRGDPRARGVVARLGGNDPASQC